MDHLDNLVCLEAQEFQVKREIPDFQVETVIAD